MGDGRALVQAAGVRVGIAVLLQERRADLAQLVDDGTAAASPGARDALLDARKNGVGRQRIEALDQAIDLIAREATGLLELLRIGDAGGQQGFQHGQPLGQRTDLRQHRGCIDRAPLAAAG